MKKALKNIDLESTNRIIEMAWEDRTPFEVIEKEFSINHGELITIMRTNLKPSSFRLWRKRASYMERMEICMRGLIINFYIPS